MFFSHFETFICVKTTSTKFLCFNPLRKCVIITIRLHFRNVECVFPHQRISYRITADLPINTYISEAIPVLDLAAVLWNGGQPLLVFHEIPRLFRLFDALHFGLEGWPRQHHQRDEKAHDIRISHHGSGQTKTPRAHRLSAAGGGYRGWTESTTWLAYRMRLLLEERERKGEGGREGERDFQGVFSWTRHTFICIFLGAVGVYKQRIQMSRDAIHCLLSALGFFRWDTFVWFVGQAK